MTFVSFLIGLPAMLLCLLVQTAVVSGVYAITSAT